LKSLADQTGGQFFETSDAKRLSTLYENLQRVLQNQFELRWTSTATASPVELTVQVANSLATASVPVNSVGTGSSASPRVVHAPAVPGPLKGRDGPIVLAGLAGIAAAAIGASVVLLRRPPAAIDQVLRAYSGSALEPVRPDAADRSFVPEAFRRAVETTARLTGGGGALERLDTKLDQADLKLRAQEAVLFYGAGVLLFSLIALVAAGPLIGLAALVLVALVPIALLNQLAEMRRSKFSNQLPDTLQLLASSLRAGYSLLQGLDAVSQEVTDPMGRELRRVVLETRLGRDMEASLGELAGRMKSQDFDWVVMAIRIQREVGGNLAELLSSVSETMISRERLRREVSALTAEGRLSMFIVAGLPIVIGMAIAVLNPGYLNLLFTTTLGKVMVLGSVVLMIFGFIWMKKTIAIEV
jgi:tight adherence protein B